MKFVLAQRFLISSQYRRIRREQADLFCRYAGTRAAECRDGDITYIFRHSQRFDFMPTLHRSLNTARNAYSFAMPIKFPADMVMLLRDAEDSLRELSCKDFEVDLLRGSASAASAMPLKASTLPSTGENFSSFARHNADFLQTYSPRDFARIPPTKRLYSPRDFIRIHFLISSPRASCA